MSAYFVYVFFALAAVYSFCLILGTGYMLSRISVDYIFLEFLHPDGLYEAAHKDSIVSLRRLLIFLPLLICVILIVTPSIAVTSWFGYYLIFGSVGIFMLLLDKLSTPEVKRNSWHYGLLGAFTVCFAMGSLAMILSYLSTLLPYFQ